MSGLLDVPLDVVHWDEAGVFAGQMSTDTWGGKALECETQDRTCYLAIFPLSSGQGKQY